MYRLTFCHTRGIAIISEVTEKSNTIIVCMYVLLLLFFFCYFLISYFEFAIRNQNTLLDNNHMYFQAFDY